MKCNKCRHWGDGDGTGLPYDAGHMNYCNQHQVAGVQHPSYGACGDPVTMVYVLYASRVTGLFNEAQGQKLMTRGTFGCILFEESK